MRIPILGGGPLAEPLAHLAERAGHKVWRVQEPAAQSDWCEVSDMVILAGSRAAVEPVLSSIASSIAQDVIIVDASIPTQRDDRSDRDERIASGPGWITTMVPRARVVRAFASVPAEALVAVLARSTLDAGDRLAVPVAGDNREAKAVVGRFMHDIGVEPFDLGALTNAIVLDPGGALWGKALNQVEMLETVGWLSGDG